MKNILKSNYNYTPKQEIKLAEIIGRTNMSPTSIILLYAMPFWIAVEVKIC